MGDRSRRQSKFVSNQKLYVGLNLAGERKIAFSASISDSQRHSLIQNASLILQTCLDAVTQL